MRLAGLCEAKSDILWEDWQDAHNADGPVMDGALVAGTDTTNARAGFL